MGGLLIPFISIASTLSIMNAFVGTGITMGLLGFYASRVDPSTLLSIEGAMPLALCSLIGLSAINIIYPTSFMMSVYLYSGIFIFGALLLIDTRQLIDNAKTRPQWDPI
mmetsp:Transcript_11458/g.12970  ORF Transcript_11458/g.12970 Transcript_11458/m.12970 type:complete len:109 (+) Transcript_11458:217-543(+)